MSVFEDVEKALTILRPYLGPKVVAELVAPEDNPVVTPRGIYDRPSLRLTFPVDGREFARWETMTSGMFTHINENPDRAVSIAQYWMLNAYMDAVDQALRVSRGEITIEDINEGRAR